MWKRHYVRTTAEETVAAPRSSCFSKGALTCSADVSYLTVITVGNRAVASILTSAQILHASLAFFTVSS